MNEENNSSTAPDDDHDAEFIPEDGEGNTGTPKDQVKIVREKLAKAIEEKQKYLDELQRAKADFINLRKRDEAEKQEMIKYANQALAEELIPVLESFEMARANKESWEKVDANWRRGIEHIHSQLLTILENHSVKEIDPKGEKFDPSIHEAIGHDPVEDKSLDHTVTEVFQKGYKLGDKVLKAPRVKVGEYKKE